MDAVPARLRVDVATVLTVYVALLLLIPAHWVVGPIGAAGTPAALVGLFVAWWWLVSRVSPPWPLDRGPQPIRVVLLLHGGLMVLTYGLMWLRPLTELEISGAHRSLIGLAALSGVALITADGIATRRRLDALLRRVVALGAVMAAVGLVQFFVGFDPVQYLQIPGLRANHEILGIGARSIFNRPFSTTLHPIEFGVALAMLLPLALHVALHASTRRQAQVWWLCLGLIAMGIPTSVSRSGILGAVVALPFLAIAWSWRRRLNVAVGAVVFTGFTWAVVPGLVGTLRSMFTGTEYDPSVQARTERVPRVLELVNEYPWLGRGTGTYSVEDYLLLDNQYYVSAIEVGVVGVTVIVALLLTGVAVGIAVHRRAAEAESRHLGMALAAGLVVALVSIFTFDAFFYQIFSGLLFLTLGCLGALWRLTADERPTPARSASAARWPAPARHTDGAGTPDADQGRAS